MERRSWFNWSFAGGVIIGALLVAAFMAGAFAALNRPAAVSGISRSESDAENPSGLRAGSPADEPSGPVTFYMYPEKTNRMWLNEDSFAWRTMSAEVFLTGYDYSTGNHYLCDGREVPASSDRVLWSILDSSDPDVLALPRLSLTDSKGRALTYRIQRDGLYPTRQDEDEAAAAHGGIKYYAFRGLPDSERLYVGGIYLIKGLPAEGARGLVPCNGQALQVSDEILFTMLGTRFGGDGKKTFNVPDMSGSVSPVEGASYYIATTGLYLPQE